MGGYIAVDLDGTLARFPHGHGNSFDFVGEPIAPMVRRVQEWLEQGTEVRIFTARVSSAGPEYDAWAEQQRKMIEAWCVVHIGQVLKVTSTKDFGMTALYDDIAFGVESNTGKLR